MNLKYFWSTCRSSGTVNVELGLNKGLVQPAVCALPCYLAHCPAILPMDDDVIYEMLLFGLVVHLIVILFISLLKDCLWWSVHVLHTWSAGGVRFCSSCLQNALQSHPTYPCCCCPLWLWSHPTGWVWQWQTWCVEVCPGCCRTAPRLSLQMS